MKIHILILFLLITTFCNGQAEKVVVQLNDSISLEMVKTDFQTKNKKIEYLDGQFPIGVNGTVLFGTDGELPTSQLSKAILKIKEKVYELKTDHMYNPWFGEGINKELFKITTDGNQVRLTGLFSDGAGTYGAEWLIIGNSDIRTILTKDEDLLIGYFGM